MFVRARDNHVWMHEEYGSTHSPRLEPVPSAREPTVVSPIARRCLFVPALRSFVWFNAWVMGERPTVIWNSGMVTMYSTAPPK